MQSTHHTESYPVKDTHAKGTSIFSCVAQCSEQLKAKRSRPLSNPWGGGVQEEISLGNDDDDVTKLCLAVAPLVPGKSGNWMTSDIEDCYGATGLGKRTESDCLPWCLQNTSGRWLLGEALQNANAQIRAPLWVGKISPARLRPRSPQSNKQRAA